ncbi:MAG TPA: FAD:protein FMN transferase [Candidatus Cloacimonetes bacterium]|nr:FAD:protein FMN transferase [Candidatus Cloacimonadota bacterium]HEX37558.1 FAD:protein FMN transferase [Candidatus Cloacimonadota bacterium]
MKKHSIQAIFLLILLAVIYFRIQHEQTKPIEETRLALGTFVTIDIQDKIKNAKQILDSTFSLIDELEATYSLHIPQSEINALNAAKDTFRISEGMEELLSSALQISDLTDGAFDITVGKVLALYDFIDCKRPSKEVIEENLPFVSFEVIEVSNNMYYKKSPNIVIDAGGIAKGFIIDEVISFLKSNGIKYAALNAGGDLYVMENPKTKSWKIGIQHPRKQQEVFGTIEVKNNAVVTSGDYEQFFMENSVRIHHILDPRTGLPSYSSVSVTVIAPDATTADGLCTALFVMGPDSGIDLVNTIDNVEALIVYENNSETLGYVFSNNFDKYHFVLLDSTAQYSRIKK